MTQIILLPCIDPECSSFLNPKQTQMQHTGEWFYCISIHSMAQYHESEFVMRFNYMISFLTLFTNKV